MRIDLSAARDILKRYPPQESSLIQVLEELHDAYNFLPKEAMQLVAKRLGVPISRVCSVATFYKAFSLKPRGRRIVRVCLGTACHIRGGSRIVEGVCQEFGIKPGQTTPDGSFTLETVNCVGACAMAPVVMIDDEYYSNMTPERLVEILRSLDAD